MSTARQFHGGDHFGPAPEAIPLRVAHIAPTPSAAPEHIPHVFGASAGLLGVALSAFGLFSILSHAKSVVHMGEELLAVNACLFAASCCAAFLTMRLPGRCRRVLGVVAEGLFLIGLSMMALVCLFLVVSIRMHR